MIEFYSKNKEGKVTSDVPYTVENKNSAFHFLASSMADTNSEKETMKKVCDFATEHNIYVGDLVDFLSDFMAL